MNTKEDVMMDPKSDNHHDGVGALFYSLALKISKPHPIKRPTGMVCETIR